jgi:hypothetical protein
MARVYNNNDAKDADLLIKRKNAEFGVIHIA